MRIKLKLDGYPCFEVDSENSIWIALQEAASKGDIELAESYAERLIETGAVLFISEEDVPKSGIDVYPKSK